MEKQMTRDPSLPPEELALTEASVQEIQLELIRRWRFNEFDGPRVVGSLRRHRGLWKAVMMDRVGIVSREGLPAMSLIKLRDLSSNTWNVDVLYVLCDSVGDAERLKRVAEEEEWMADTIEVYGDEQRVGMALGSFGGGQRPAILEAWWD
jgi:hypothetical protein